MPVGLSYPGLRCVLEHLDAVKRIRIASRSAVLQRCEKSIPLRLNRLLIGNVVEGLDYFYFGFERAERKLEFSCNGKRTTCIRDAPQNLDNEAVEERINQYYMGGRTSVYAKRVRFMESVSSSALPMDSMFKITELDAEFKRQCLAQATRPFYTCAKLIRFG